MLQRHQVALLSCTVLFHGFVVDGWMTCNIELAFTISSDIFQANLRERQNAGQSRVPVLVGPFWYNRSTIFFSAHILSKHPQPSRILRFFPANTSLRPQTSGGRLALSGFRPASAELRGGGGLDLSPAGCPGSQSGFDLCNSESVPYPFTFQPHVCLFVLKGIYITGIVVSRGRKLDMEEIGCLRNPKQHPVPGEYPGDGFDVGRNRFFLFRFCQPKGGSPYLTNSHPPWLLMLSSSIRAHPWEKRAIAPMMKFPYLGDSSTA